MFAHLNFLSKQIYQSRFILTGFGKKNRLRLRNSGWDYFILYVKFLYKTKTVR